jgi:hypothetical protein
MAQSQVHITELQRQLREKELLAQQTQAEAQKLREQIQQITPSSSLSNSLDLLAPQCDYPVAVAVPRGDGVSQQRRTTLPRSRSTAGHAAMGCRMTVGWTEIDSSLASGLT